ncbi:response regulator [Brevundimonas sp.]|uniref:response regulator n=1 Tax=Brevundimonas sp. TaxID=1871086 RepID=UPI002D74D761|nr:response regulator [Brevundimonas sp.]HYC73860.1 response regulator [Brevundimonas sp.]
MAEFPGVRVLLVEDEGGVALLLESLLEDLGCEVTASVARLSRAFDALESQDFDLAVLDVNLGGETSFDLARVLRHRGIPLVFSTGYGTSGLPDDLRACAVLSKPFTLTSLQQAIAGSMLRREV